MRFLQVGAGILIALPEPFITNALAASLFVGVGAGEYVSHINGQRKFTPASVSHAFAQHKTVSESLETSNVLWNREATFLYLLLQGNLGFGSIVNHLLMSQFPTPLRSSNLEPQSDHCENDTTSINTEGTLTAEENIQFSSTEKKLPDLSSLRLNHKGKTGILDYSCSTGQKLSSSKDACLCEATSKAFIAKSKSVDLELPYNDGNHLPMK